MGFLVNLVNSYTNKAKLNEDIEKVFNAIYEIKNVLKQSDEINFLVHIKLIYKVEVESPLGYYMLDKSYFIGEKYIYEKECDTLNKRIELCVDFYQCYRYLRNEINSLKNIRASNYFLNQEDAKEVIESLLYTLERIFEIANDFYEIHGDNLSDLHPKDLEKEYLSFIKEFHSEALVSTVVPIKKLKNDPDKSHPFFIERLDFFDKITRNLLKSIQYLSCNYLLSYRKLPSHLENQECFSNDEFIFQIKKAHLEGIYLSLELKEHEIKESIKKLIYDHKNNNSNCHNIKYNMTDTKALEKKDPEGKIEKTSLIKKIFTSLMRKSRKYEFDEKRKYSEVSNEYYGVIKSDFIESKSEKEIIKKNIKKIVTTKREIIERAKKMTNTIIEQSIAQVVDREKKKGILKKGANPINPIKKKVKFNN